MRTEVLDYINSLALGGFLLTQELPWEADGTALYVKNLKKIYVDVPEYVTKAIEIAHLELEQRRLPFILKRPMPDGSFEYWRLSDLMVL